MEKKALLKKMVKKAPAQPAKTAPLRELKKMQPLPNKDKKMPIIKDKIRKIKDEPSWMKKDYKPGSIMRGYTKYA